MAGGRFSWEDDSLSRNLNGMGDRLDNMIAMSTDFQATRAEARMREAAPWTDQTSNARNGLSAGTEHKPRKSHTIILSHGVSYGFWLEVRYAGRNAVVMPTAASIGKELMEMIGRNWGPTISGGGA